MAAKTITVSTNAQLTAALRTARGGETILLAPGDYGGIRLASLNPASTVTIRSADPAHGAVLSDLRIDRSSNFSFSNIDVHRPLAAGEPDHTQAAYISNSSNLSFVGMHFTGSMDNNAWNDGVGLRISYSKNVNVLGSSFEQWNNALTFDHDTGLVVAGNTVRAVREGMDFAAVHNVVVDRNSFTAFQPNYAAGDHSDSIQFWNNGVKEGSDHVTISDNVILQGSNQVQGIFISAELPDLAYKMSNFIVENNLYNGDARNAISLIGIYDSIIRGNTVTTSPNPRLEAGINIRDTTNVTVDHNIAPLLLSSGKNTGAVWSANLDIWDSNQKQGIALDSVFGAKGGTGQDVAAYALKAGGAAALAHAGFALADGTGAAFDVSHLAGYSHLGGVMFG